MPIGVAVGQNPIESLHVLFTLYLELKNNPFIKGRDGAVSRGAMGQMNGFPGEVLQL